jgi:hypothetical protein
LRRGVREKSIQFVPSNGERLRHFVPAPVFPGLFALNIEKGLPVFPVFCTRDAKGPAAGVFAVCPNSEPPLATEPVVAALEKEVGAGVPVCGAPNEPPLKLKPVVAALEEGF